MRVLDIIIKSLQDLGGEASLKDLYEQAKKYKYIPEESIRARIYSHSSDSKYYKKKDEDLFRKIDKGIWALKVKEKSDNLSSVSWIDEFFIPNNFEIGNTYKKSEVRELSNLSKSKNVREQWVGIVRLANAILLFVSLDKSKKEKQHRYNDFFIKEDFYWESQNDNSINTPAIKQIIEGKPVYLFSRISDKSDFIFVGELKFSDYDDSVSPIQFEFEVIDFKKNPNEALSDLYNWSSSEGNLIPNIALREKPKRSSVKRFAKNQKYKKFVEEFAMDKAKCYYESLGFKVIDCSHLRKIGYDYLCVKNKEKIEVEVKGTGENGSSVIVTYNEVENARKTKNRCDIYIVHTIKLITEGETYKVCSFRESCIENWNPTDDNLKSVSYYFSTGILT